MKTKHSEGVALDLVAPYDVASGAPFKVGAIIAIAAYAALNGAAVVGYTEGAYTVPKATGAAWSDGDTLYWDDTAKNFTKTPTNNTKAGYAIAGGAISGATSGVIRLTPQV